MTSTDTTLNLSKTLQNVTPGLVQPQSDITTSAEDKSNETLQNTTTTFKDDVDEGSIYMNFLYDGAVITSSDTTPNLSMDVLHDEIETILVDININSENLDLSVNGIHDMVLCQPSDITQNSDVERIISRKMIPKLVAYSDSDDSNADEVNKISHSILVFNLPYQCICISHP